ncbi:MAG: GFA family protein [Sphingomonadales bacterium]|nr:MAG: GFA family protein [Sphingomonadales bacterium]TNF05024.1 MAG: GFA family protein [Sphingomonadales bacterium]
MSDKVMEGGCACGNVRYRVAGDPIFVNNCHCTLCQQQTGSTSVVNMFYETDRLTHLSGETSRHVVKAGRGGDHAIIRCAECGTALWSHYSRLGEHGVGIRVGTLDAPASVRPDAVIFAADRMPWVALPDDIPVFETTYDASELLPPERFARLKALAAKARPA